ncbi:hypothetical protein BCR34DRAFT_617484 [Clohesyomyces aquaticus]|uniref:Calcineurin-like phosphoesterase domain-containing protein n=1 Tax=Clohesyomyces aquaticus TaxID=1231657 RepID=A0A1Y1Z236_9PLEO|nr:hypothetical protein BCR34DRAFT_617484 [Clohesyomyces aquaticus]
MTLFPPQFQVYSDLHLETPVGNPLYKSFKLSVNGNNLFLLGDIGLVKDDGLFTFLRKLVAQTTGVRIFYVMGNHEAYQMSLDDAVARLRAFATDIRSQYGDRFHILHRDRHDLNNITILGCTLWSSVPPNQAAEVQKRLTDFNEQRGIHGWSLEQHNQQHQMDLVWLNAQVQEITTKEPGRQIIIVTHHSPTCDPRAVDPTHRGSPISSGFMTDLSSEICWMSPSVKMWAFGHTHFSCAFQDENTSKLVMANQKGYSGVGDSGSGGLSGLIVEADGQNWRFVTAGSRELSERALFELAHTPTRLLPTAIKWSWPKSDDKEWECVDKHLDPFHLWTTGCQSKTDVARISKPRRSKLPKIEVQWSNKTETLPMSGDASSIAKFPWIRLVSAIRVSFPELEAPTEAALEKMADEDNFGMQWLPQANITIDFGHNLVHPRFIFQRTPKKLHKPLSIDTNGMDAPIGWAIWIDEDFWVPWYVLLVLGILSIGIFWLLVLNKENLHASGGVLQNTKPLEEDVPDLFESHQH